MNLSELRLTLDGSKLRPIALANSLLIDACTVADTPHSNELPDTPPHSKTDSVLFVDSNATVWERADRALLTRTTKSI